MNQPAPYTIENADIADELQPVLYIQRYHYPNRSYRVVSKEAPVPPGERFRCNLRYHGQYWLNNPLLINDMPFDPDGEIETEVIAYVDRDEEHPPVDDPQDVKAQPLDPCFLVAYDHEKHCYLCEVTGVYGHDLKGKTIDAQDEENLGNITGKTLVDTIAQGVAALDRLIEHALHS